MGPALTWTASAARGLYLSLLGAVYAVAFASFWYQYPGLLGSSDGLLPVDAFVAAERRRVDPKQRAHQRGATHLRHVRRR